MPMKSRRLGQLVSGLDALLAKVLHKNPPRESTRSSETNYDARLLYADPGLWNIKYGIDLYSICFVEETEVEGFRGFELMLTTEGFVGSQRVGRILFWDANGEISFETFDRDVPVVVIEALIAEAKSLIKR